jgi:8-hydroxy-5-deazaflavin:NADPH oxidoreductase
MDIGIIGTGNVGTALGTGFADAGHRVMLGTRGAARKEVLDWVARDTEHRGVGDRRTAVEFGEIVIFAVPGRVLGETAESIGLDAFAGKTVIDATNPVGHDEQGQMIDHYGEDDSGAELLQRQLGDVPVVKALNEILAPHMLHPNRSEHGEVRIAGDDESAKGRVAELLERFGWTVRDLGPLSKARELERAVIDRYAHA